MTNGHPAWCESHNNGIHRSRLWPTSRAGDRPIEVHAYLWRSDLPGGPLTGVGLDFTTEGERDSFLIELGQARALRHVLLGLLDRAQRRP
jgi:hypothetical protein